MLFFFPPLLYLTIQISLRFLLDYIAGEIVGYLVRGSILLVFFCLLLCLLF